MSAGEKTKAGEQADLREGQTADYTLSHLNDRDLEIMHL